MEPNRRLLTHYIEQTRRERELEEKEKEKYYFYKNSFDDLRYETAKLTIFKSDRAGSFETVPGARF